MNEASGPPVGGVGLDIRFGYAWEKLYLAVRFLATSNADLGDRLRDSFQGSLSTLRDESFPGAEDLQKEFAAIKNLISKGDIDERVGTVGDATRNMINEEERKLAERIFCLFINVTKRYHGVWEE